VFRSLRHASGARNCEKDPQLLQFYALRNLFRSRQFAPYRKMRALAVTSASRSRFMPDVPTMAEADYLDIKADSWVGILVPAGTPKNITALLNRSVVDSLGEPDVKERLAALGYDVVGSTPDEFKDQLKAEIGMWAKVIRAANIAPL
jgi:tripartite-type tricarboxylate transporter receptor subunit TctC